MLIVLLSLPSLEVVNGFLYTLLVVANHILVHVGIVGADVLLSAAIWHRAETQWWVLVCWLLKLHKKKKRRWAEIKVTGGRTVAEMRERSRSVLRDEELQRFKDFTFKEEPLCYTFLKSSEAERD